MTAEETRPRRDSVSDLLPIGRSLMIGRMPERDAVAAAVGRSLAEGRCEVVTVIGNPGVGRSRMVTEVVADLAERHPTLRVYRGAVRGESGVQGAVARVLRSRFGLTEGGDAHAQANEVCNQVMELFGDRRVDEILHFLGTFLGLRFGATALTEAVDLDPRTAQQVARAVLRRLFEVDAGRAPVMLIFEDVHLAGVDGIHMLRDLVESFRNAPISVLFTARPELLALCSDFCATPRGRHLRVDLGPLSPSESTVLAQMLLAPIENTPRELVQTAVRLGGGNPMLIEEIVRIFFTQGVIQVTPEGEALIDLDRLAHIHLPMSVEDAVHARIAALSPPERELLERAALMGPVFWVGGLVVLGRTGREPPALWGGGQDLAPHYRDLLAGLAERDYVLAMPDSSLPGDEEYVFKHNLEREKLAALVSPEIRTQLHLVLAEWLEVRLVDRGEEQLDLLAAHYEAGDRPLRAARCYLKSADHARARYANEKAVEHYKRGLGLLGEHDVGLRMEAHHHLGDVSAHRGRSDDAMKSFEEMLALSWRLDARGRGGAAHNRIGRLHRDAGRLDEAMKHLGTALALFEAAGDDRGIASSYDDIGKVHWIRGSYDTALRFLQDALDRREAHGDKRSIALSLNNIGLVYQDSGQYRKAFDALVRARDLRREVDDLPGLVITLNNLGTIHSDRGEEREAIGLWNQALEIAREIGDRRRQAVLQLNIGEAQYRQRNVDEALEMLTEVEQLCHEIGDRLMLAECWRAMGKAHFLRGSISTALRWLERALELFEQVRSRVHVGVARRSLAEVLSVHGPETSEGQRAETLFREALSVFEELGAEIEFARTARTFADFLATAPEGTVSEMAFMEAESLRSRADEIYSRMRHGAVGTDSRDLEIKIAVTNPGIKRSSIAVDLGAAPTPASERESMVDALPRAETPTPPPPAPRRAQP